MTKERIDVKEDEERERVSVPGQKENEADRAATAGAVAAAPECASRRAALSVCRPAAVQHCGSAHHAHSWGRALPGNRQRPGRDPARGGFRGTG